MTSGAAEPSAPPSLDEVFCDTCILLNFVQQEWEADRTTFVLEEAPLRIVIGEAVQDEFETVTSRRKSAYQDLLTYLREGEVSVDTFEPHTRGNDERHLYEIVGKLEELDPAEAAAKFREYQRKFRARKTYVLESVVDEVVFTSPPLFFEHDLATEVSNRADCRVLAQAADWADTGGSGVLVTLDGDDIHRKADEINELIMGEFGEGTRLCILVPERVLEHFESTDPNDGQ